MRLAELMIGASIIFPSSATAPLPSSSAIFAASTTRRACSTSLAVGANALCSGSIWRGLMRDLPSKPRRLMTATSRRKPSVLLASLKTTSKQWILATRAACRIAARA